MRRKILSMVTVVMILFMAVGCGDGGLTTKNSSTNQETQLNVVFKQSENTNFQKVKRTDVQSVRLSISKGSTFYLEGASMTKDAVTKKWGIGINLDNSLAPFDVVAIARDSVDDSGNILFRTPIGTVIADLTANLPIALEEVEDAVSSTNLPVLKNVTHTASGNTISINFVVQNTSSYALSSESGGTFDTPTGTVSDSTEASFSATYTKGTGESIVNLKAILTNADGSSRTFSFSISQDVLSVNFPPEVVINVEEQLSPANTFKLTATVSDDDSTTWDYAWGRIRGAKTVTTGEVSPNELYIESISTVDELYPLCFALTVTDDAGASSSLDYCIKNAEDGYVGLKKTGQTKSYDEAGTEVTNTSLKDDGFYQKGLTIRYTRDDVTNIVTDHVTGLMWWDTPFTVTVRLGGNSVQNFCKHESIERLVGSGWRVPSIKELNTIVDRSTNTTDRNYFKNLHSFSYGSSTSMNYKFYSINLENGTIYMTDLTPEDGVNRYVTARRICVK